MNKTVLALGVVCVALAGLDVKLLLDLRALREARAAGPTGSVAEPSMTAASPAGKANDARGTVAGPSTATAPASTGPAGESAAAPATSEADKQFAKLMAERRARRTPREIARDEEFVRMYQDPRQRRQLVDEMALVLASRYRGADRTLGIEPGRWDMFIDRLAQAEVEGRGRRLQCESDPSCLAGSAHTNWNAEYERVQLEVLGEAKTRELQTYSASLDQRRTVEALQTRLSGERLSPASADELILALWDEGMRVKNSWPPSVGGFDGIGTGDLGMIYFPRTGATIEQKIAAATEYSNRLRARAAPLLTPKQRAVFDAMQDQLLRNAITFIRSGRP